jgi:hypothetical protein
MVHSLCWHSRAQGANHYLPGQPTDPSNLVETTKWQRKYNHAHDQQKWWDENTQKIYNLVMQHSMSEMKTKLLTMDS